MLHLLCLLFVNPLLASDLEIEADVPIEVVIDGQVAARIYHPATVTLHGLTPGAHELIVFRGGTGTPMGLTLPEEGVSRLLVGRAAMELLDAADAAETTTLTTGQLELRLEGGLDSALVRLGDQRLTLTAGAPTLLPALPVGEHQVEIRSGDNAVIWARGVLTVSGGDELVIVISEGRTPEIFGSKRAWRPQR